MTTIGIDHASDSGVHFLPLSMAMIAGTLYAVAANGVSYCADQSKKTGVVYSARRQLAIDSAAFCTYNVGGLIATVAYAMGDPVPLLQGTLVATNLLLNMVFQIYLGISVYTKAMRIGTILCFLVVLFQLAFVGPLPRSDETEVMAFFSQSSAIAFFVFLLAITVLSACGVYVTRKHSSDSFVKIVSWAVLLGAFGSGTDNAASTFGVISGWTLYAAFLAYSLVSVLVLVLSAKAPGVCDANTYVPLQLSLQLILNGVTGVFVWNDLDRMAGKPLEPYVVTFCIIILSVYVASPNADLVESMVRWRIFRTTKLSQNLASTSFGKAILKLLISWNDLKTGSGEELEDAAKEALEHALTEGTERGRLSPQDMVHLVVKLYGASGSYGGTALFLKWMDSTPYCQEYLKHDPDFREKLLGVLPDHERACLGASFMKTGAGRSPLNEKLEMRSSHSLASGDYIRPPHFQG